ncbi:hypothetical protein VINE108274_03370 [Vibrio neptunius]
MLFQSYIPSLYFSFFETSTLLDVYMSLLVDMNPAKITLSNFIHNES